MEKLWLLLLWWKVCLITVLWRQQFKRSCRIVSGARKYDHVTPHCLGYPLRTNYTTAKLPWLLNAFPDTSPNIWRHNSLPVSKKTASGQRTFYYRTIGLRNNLDPLLKSSCSVQVFKRILKNKLLDNFVNTPWTSFIFIIFRDYKV